MVERVCGRLCGRVVYLVVWHVGCVGECGDFGGVGRVCGDECGVFRCMVGLLRGGEGVVCLCGRLAAWG